MHTQNGQDYSSSVRASDEPSIFRATIKERYVVIVS